jgi:uncharacterized protein YjbI with pentapeptide repeats
MKIEIKNRFSGQIIIAGEYESIKDALKKNRNANLRGADLRGANLRGADLRGADLCEADLCGANLRGADLRGANLREANLRGANLRGANLGEANLRGAKNISLPIINLYGTSHSFFYMNGEIQIGCEKHTVEHWIENYKTIGEENHYTGKQIKEYFGYINMVYNLMKQES